ncbi:putative folate-biopterin transporter 6 [Carex littledalei]|uniref:Putative folate-biopterin transporter 6 n=1 Tax=Carex littledalei TaxID=544730 RepID=A0A833RHG0_9POAL|nr:putative folate-biopterin transporter 6 [Carex littledalei]
MDSETQDLIHRQSVASDEPEKLEDGPGPHQSIRHGPTFGIELILQPFTWIAMLSRELNPSFIFGVFLVYGLSQGFTGSFFRVVSDYYWKDVQKVQPSAVQMFSGFYYIPWLMKPVWGVLTDAFPVYGYRRRPYFVFAGIIGTVASLMVSSITGLPVAMALLCFVGLSVCVAMADVTIDACIATNSINKPKLAPDMQSLCGFLSSLGALIGYSSSGFLVHHFGSQAALSLMAVPAVLLVLLGFVLFESKNYKVSDKEKAWEKVGTTVTGMGRTIKISAVWQPSLYMFLSLALSVSTHEGQFYWYTDKTAGPHFSQEFVGMIYAIGAMASMVGVLIYHKFLKNFRFRTLLFYAQLLYGVSGILDLFFVLRWNLKLGLPDPIFVIMEECTSRIITRIRWIPMIVLSTKLCPLGIEGTFFALLMCIDSLGFLTHKIGGGLLLQALHVTRTDFTNLWLALFIRNVLRFCTLFFIFLVPNASPNDVLVPSDLLTSQGKGSGSESDSDFFEETVQLAKLGNGDEV